MACESVIEQECVRIAEADGWLVRKVEYVNRRGAPDRWFMRDGWLVIIEFKRPGEKPRKQQQREHERLAAAGFPVHLIDSVEDFRRVFSIS